MKKRGTTTIKVTSTESVEQQLKDKYDLKPIENWTREEAKAKFTLKKEHMEFFKRMEQKYGKGFFPMLLDAERLINTIKYLTPLDEEMELRTKRLDKNRKQSYKIMRKSDQSYFNHADIPLKEDNQFLKKQWQKLSDEEDAILLRMQKAADR